MGSPSLPRLVLGRLSEVSPCPPSSSHSENPPLVPATICFRRHLLSLGRKQLGGFRTVFDIFGRLGRGSSHDVVGREGEINYYWVNHPYWHIFIRALSLRHLIGNVFLANRIYNYSHVFSDYAYGERYVPWIATPHLHLLTGIILTSQRFPQLDPPECYFGLVSAFRVCIVDVVDVDIDTNMHIIRNTILTLWKQWCWAPCY